MCGIWDWQSTIVKDLNDSQDPKHTLFCRNLRACCHQLLTVIQRDLQLLLNCENIFAINFLLREEILY